MISQPQKKHVSPHHFFPLLASTQMYVLSIYSSVTNSTLPPDSLCSPQPQFSPPPLSTLSAPPLTPPRRYTSHQQQYMHPHCPTPQQQSTSRFTPHLQSAPPPPLNTSHSHLTSIHNNLCNTPLNPSNLYITLPCNTHKTLSSWLQTWLNRPELAHKYPAHSELNI